MDRSARSDSKLFVISHRCGRLGNRLILFANFIALAAEQGHRVVNFTFHSYAHLFETTRRDIYCRYPVAARRSWLDVIPGLAPVLRKTRICYRTVRAAGDLHERLPVCGRSVVTLREVPGRVMFWLDGPDVQAQVRDARLVFIAGWPFRVSLGCLERHAEKIRAYFRPVEEYERSSGQAVKLLRQNADVVVGVHIRHGDYAGWMGGQCFFPTSRYAAWMRQLAEQFPGCKVAFLVCSDEPRNAGEFPGLSVGFGTGSPMGDLYALAKCDYVLGPLSTFSQWASFYGNKPLLHLPDRHVEVERASFKVADLAEIPSWQISR